MDQSRFNNAMGNRSWWSSLGDYKYVIIVISIVLVVGLLFYMFHDTSKGSFTRMKDSMSNSFDSSKTNKTTTAPEVVNKPTNSTATGTSS